MSAPAASRLSGRRLLVAAVALAAAEWVLIALVASIERPPLGALAEITDWLDRADPAVVVTSALYLASLGLCTYLVTVVTLALVAHLLQAPRLAGGLLRAVPAGLRHAVVSGAAVATLTTASPTAALAGTAGPGQQADPPGVAVMVKLDGDAVPEGDPTTTTTSPTPAPSPIPAEPSASRDEEPTWTVEPGDSFWSIATRVIHQQAPAGEPPTDHEVARYWHTLVRANSDRLAAAGNPDVIFTGQELVLPRIDPVRR